MHANEIANADADAPQRSRTPSREQQPALQQRAGCLESLGPLSIGRQTHDARGWGRHSPVPRCSALGE